MKKILICLMCLVAMASCAGGGDGTSALKEGFQTPPLTARPGVYWYFMDGNFSKDGITKDLESMRDAGIGYVIFLEVGVGVPRGPVDFMSEEWTELFRFAVSECERLDIQMILGIGPGWTGSGGPWVEASRSMQHLRWISSMRSSCRMFLVMLHTISASLALIAPFLKRTHNSSRATRPISAPRLLRLSLR